MSRLLLIFAALLILAGLSLLAYVALSGGEDEVASPVLTLPEPVITPPAATATTTTPAAPATATAVDVESARLQIPAIEVDAPVQTLGVLAGGVMESPHGPFDVGWYSFSSQPGTGGNAVFSGHVDYANVGPAVFYRLHELQPGDQVVVTLSGGVSYHYTVVSSEVYNADTAPVPEIVGPTDVPTLTLITCAGLFDRSALQYDQRLVVRAQRSDLAATD